MKRKDIYLTALIFVIFSVSVTAQKGYYSNTAEFISEENPFPQNSIQKAYIVEDAQVIEYFDASTRGFIGFFSDDEKLNVKEMNVVKTNPHLKSMLRKVPITEALTFVYDKITPGMKIDEVIEILGQPDDFKYAISGTNQLLYYYYNEGQFEKLTFKDDILVSAI